MLEKDWEIFCIFYYFFGFVSPAPQEPKKPKPSDFYWFGLNLKKNPNPKNPAVPSLKITPLVVKKLIHSKSLQNISNIRNKHLSFVLGNTSGGTEI